MEWRTLDGLTQGALVATIVAVVALVVPPIGVAAAIVALVLGGAAWQRARREATHNAVARNCTLISAAIIVLLVVGNLAYSAAN